MTTMKFSPMKSLIFGFSVLLIPFAAARAGLTHRYSFTDSTTVKDSVGQTDGKLQNGAAIADGKLTLKNEDKTSGDAGVQYVDFSQPLLPAKGSASIVVWFTAADVGAFSRILDIGDQQDAEGRAFIYFTPRNADDQSRAAITATDAGTKTFQDNDRLDDGKPHMVALVIDGAAKKLHVFIDGKEPKPAEDLSQNTLDAVRQKHTWIGRSAFDSDAGFTGAITEFRTYDNALSTDHITAIFKAGPHDDGLHPTTQP